MNFTLFNIISELARRSGVNGWGVAAISALHPMKLLWIPGTTKGISNPGLVRALLAQAAKTVVRFSLKPTLKQGMKSFLQGGIKKSKHLANLRETLLKKGRSL